MRLIHAPHLSTGAAPGPRRSRKFGWLLVAGSIVAMTIYTWRTQQFSLPRMTSMKRESDWWQGVHTNVAGREMPRLQLASSGKSQATGFLETTFSAGYHVRLPIMNAIPSETDVIFAVEDPNGFTQPRGLQWYLLHKTGATTTTLYRLNQVYQSPSAGQMIPTNLDSSHRRVADLTSKPPTSTTTR